MADRERSVPEHPSLLGAVDSVVEAVPVGPYGCDVLRLDSRVPGLFCVSRYGRSVSMSISVS